MRRTTRCGRRRSNDPATPRKHRDSASTDHLRYSYPPQTSFKFIEPQPGIRFRNEEEAREACRVIATLRESFFDDCAPDIVDRCGRNCQKCAQRASHTHPSSDEAIPNYRLVVTEVDEDPQSEEIVVDQVSEEEMTEVGHFKAWQERFFQSQYAARPSWPVMSLLRSNILSNSTGHCPLVSSLCSKLFYDEYISSKHPSN